MGAMGGPHRPSQGGVDALIGRSLDPPADRQGFDGRQRWWSERDLHWIDFKMADFVTERGGEYFFVPSKEFLRRVGEATGHKVRERKTKRERASEVPRRPAAKPTKKAKKSTKTKKAKKK